MKKKTFTHFYFSFGFISLLCFSGVIRMDVAEEIHLKLAKEPQFECVGRVCMDSSTIGSCVLISDHSVLCAALDLIEWDYRMDTTPDFGEGISIVGIPINHRVMNPNKLNLDFNGIKRKIKSISVHPNFKMQFFQKPCFNIAVLELQEPISNIQPAQLNTNSNELGSKVIGVGYGASRWEAEPNSLRFQNKKIAGENVVDSLSGEKYNGLETLLMCDFDHPSNATCNRMGLAKARPLEYLASHDDSGGGLFRKEKNEWELIGIYSVNNDRYTACEVLEYYGFVMEWTRISAFADWILNP